MRNGSVYARPTWAPRTAGTDGSASRGGGTWPSARVGDHGEPGSGERHPTILSTAEEWGTPNAHERVQTPRDVDHGVQLANQVELWQTPATFLGKYRRQVNQTERTEELLPAQAENWQTITATDAVGRDYTYPSGDKDNPFPTLTGQARDWPTPSVADTEGGRAARSGERSDELLLNGMASAFSPPARATPAGPTSSPQGPTSRRLWQTPCAETNNKSERAMSREGNSRRGGGQRSPPGLEQQATGEIKPEKRRLNPAFVEWLMGWPIGWTDFAPVEMESWWLKQLSHFENFCGGL